MGGKTLYPACLCFWVGDFSTFLTSNLIMYMNYCSIISGINCQCIIFFIKLHLQYLLDSSTLVTYRRASGIKSTIPKVLFLKKSSILLTLIKGNVKERKAANTIP